MPRLVYTLRNSLKLAITIGVLSIATLLTLAQLQSQRKPVQQGGERDELGLTCAQVLAMPSSDYIARHAAINDSRVDGQLRGIGRFGKCFDERTARLAASLARRGKGPKKRDLTNLNDMEQKLRDFTTTALADTNPPGDSLKAAYAALYQKQFRYEFYESYEEKPAKPKPPSSPGAAKAKTTTPSASPSSTTKVSASTAQQTSTPLPEKPALQLEGVPASAARSSASSEGAASPTANLNSQATPTSTPPADAPTTSAPTSAAKDVDPVTKAKNHFGELLGALPPEKIHEVHSSFGKLFAGNPVSEDLKVEIYTYAIFLLEGPKDKPFAPPPF